MRNVGSEFNSPVEFLHTVVHAILSLLASFSLLFFLYIFDGIPGCLRNADNYKEKANKWERGWKNYTMYTRACTCTYLCQFESYKNILIAGSLQNIYTTYLSQEDLIHRNSSLKATIIFLCKKKKFSKFKQRVKFMWTEGCWTRQTWQWLRSHRR